ESPLVGLNYVRAAASNLALADPGAPLGALPHLSPIPAEKHYAGPPTAKDRLGSLEIPPGPPAFSELSGEDSGVPSLASYGDPKANSSLLKRLAEKFGLTH